MRGFSFGGNHKMSVWSVDGSYNRVDILCFLPFSHTYANQVDAWAPHNFIRL